MKVYYSGDYWGGHKIEHAGKGMPIKREFLWSGLKWYVPAAYACSKGLVIDFCVEIPKDRIENYYKRWNQNERISKLNDDELEQREKENPFLINIEVIARINGKELVSSRMCAVDWHPCEEEREHRENVQDELMEYYDCDRSQGWSFIRACFPWKTARKPKIKTLSLTFREHPVAYSGTHFTTEDPHYRQEITCIHPVSQQEYKITIDECETKTLQDTLSRFYKDVELPNYYKMLTYTIIPELAQKDFRIQDCARGDKPRSRENSISNEISSCGDFIIGSSDAPSAIFITGKNSEENNKRIACSSLHFTQVPKVEWKTIFYIKENEDYSLDIIF